MERVLVLLSSYNGGKHIEEQIRSILGQKNVVADILIRDDGSIDDTVNIVKNISVEEGRIKVLREKNIGFIRSFMTLVYLCNNSYKYYAFADQDDVWLPHKLDVAVKKLSDFENEPALYYGMMTQVDEDLAIWDEQQSFKFPPEKSMILFQNFAQGSTIVFNNKLLNLAQQYHSNSELVHDVWMPILAKYFGRIVGDRNSYILYRKYEDSVTVNGKKHYWKNLFRDIVTKKRLTNYALHLINGYEDRLSDSDLKDLQKIKDYRRTRNKLYILRDRSIRRNTLKGTILLKMAILFNRMEDEM